jgi:predicted metalloprotease with PDZ domain
MGSSMREFREARKQRSIALGVAFLFFVFIGPNRIDHMALNAVASATTSETTNPTIVQTPEKANYKITLLGLSPLKLGVTANIPVNGKMLDMDHTYPADLPGMASKGWPALISSLIVRDGGGNKIAVTTAGAKGWQLTDSINSIVKLSYDVDYSLFAASAWSSPLESAFADDKDVIIVGRSVFITTSHMRSVNVEFVTPEGWIPIVPWLTEEGKTHHYDVRTVQDLTNNMMAFSTREPDVVTAAGFRLGIVSMGHWEHLRPLVRQVLETIIRREVGLMYSNEKEIYNVILIPISDEGGNAFRQSFVYCHTNPDKDNVGVWGNALAHEIFHYWNYARLKGVDYARCQWFQEGFTEYVANLVMVSGGIIDSNAFVDKLSEHVNNYRKLKTSLEDYGTHKGPPLYSAGALVAFMWDVRIRQASGGKRNLGDLFRNLMIQTDSGARGYSWTDIKASLQATADFDWEGFYQIYIKGHEPLPLEASFPMACLRINKLADGSEQVEYDTTGSVEAKTLWHTLITD